MDFDVPWEKLDKVSELQAAAKKKDVKTPVAV
jgi:hypothetical protein